MPIRARTLCNDMLNFARNQFTNILLLALLTALISIVLSHVLSPGSEQLITLSDGRHIDDTANMSFQQRIQHMSMEQQRILLKASAANSLAGLIGDVLLVGGLLTMIRQVSNRHSISVLRAICLSAPLFPRLLLLIFFTTLLVQLGLLLIVIPGIMLAIAFSLSPIIVTNDNLSAIKSMRLSASLALANLRLLAPAVLVWLLAKSAILLLATRFALVSPFVTAILLNGLSNLITILLLIYLYRLYMFLRQA
ncbi:YciC family protein [Candidatus Doolittlea endobia]|uniref:UPF0259 membrane protein MHIR_DE00558 n=1 Tax=Candidatus Doolittlea endobia TaxID=1778262 RepID=A0A143WSX6_9ENTR|nr:YciC family protein [Candidatus Doolittlea endobia]CUX96800.1 hypothetical protein MHIR_DE00558 [Candidatus Doolittlea endobia]